MNASQPAVATLEAGADMRISTLARYLTAIGGKGELQVTFADHQTISIAIDQLAGARQHAKAS